MLVENQGKEKKSAQSMRYLADAHLTRPRQLMSPTRVWRLRLGKCRFRARRSSLGRIWKEEGEGGLGVWRRVEIRGIEGGMSGGDGFQGRIRGIQLIGK